MAEQPSALCMDSNMSGSNSSDNTDPLQHDGDGLVNDNKFVGGPLDNTGGSQEALGEGGMCSI